MTTRSFWLVGSLLFGMVSVGLITLNAVVIALALPLIAYIAVAVFFAPKSLDLDVKRELSTDKITQGMDVAIKIRARNQGDSVEELYVVDLLAAPIQNLEGQTACVASPQPGEVVEFQYHLRGMRGRYRYEAVQTWALDPFGLFEIRALFPAPGDILVYPQVIPLKSLSIRPPQTKGFSGPIPSRKSGAGMNFFGVREYQLGDSLRHINWKVSARHLLDLFTNEYEQERIADVGLILDARTHGDLTYRGQRLFEYAVLATGSLAEMFLADGHCLSLLIYGPGIARVFPGYGKIQRERVLRALAYADTGMNYALEHLRYLPARLLPPRCQLVYISPLYPEDLEPLVRFQSQGYEVLVVSPDPVYFEWMSAAHQSQPGFRLATRFAQVERSLLFNNLRRAGIQVFNWKVDQPLTVLMDRIRLQTLLYHRARRVVQ